VGTAVGRAFVGPGVGSAAAVGAGVAVCRRWVGVGDGVEWVVGSGRIGQGCQPGECASAVLNVVATSSPATRIAANEVRDRCVIFGSLPAGHANRPAVHTDKLGPVLHRSGRRRTTRAEVWAGSARLTMGRVTERNASVTDRQAPALALSGYHESHGPNGTTPRYGGLMGLGSDGATSRRRPDGPADPAITSV
jgi:hypothetical protein